MDKVEYRIFTECAEWPFPLYNLHGCAENCADLSSVIAWFDRLLANGDLFTRIRQQVGFRNRRGYDGLGESAESAGALLYTPTAKEIETAILTNTPSLVFGMTERGANRWEAFAKPDWSRYVDIRESRLDENGECETNLWAGTRTLLEQALHLGYLGWPVPGSEEWRAVSPWHATYWKTLAEGWHVKLRTRVDWSVYEGAKAAEMATFFAWF